MKTRLGTIGALLLAIVAAVPACSGSKTDALKIRAWQNRQADLFTNDEPMPLTRCDMDLIGQDGGFWQAVLRDRVLPKKTIAVPWSYFRTNINLPMPRRGVAGDRLVVTCFLGDGEQQRNASFTL